MNADADYENLSIDSTSVKVHQHSAGAKRGINSENNQFIGTSCGGKTTKIHAVVGDLGNPIYFELTAGNVYDGKVVTEVLSHVNLVGSNVLGDRTYGSKEIRDYISGQNGVYTIPPKSNIKEPRYCDFWLYKERHLVECFFQKLKDFRRVATRYDKLASYFIAFIHIASIFLLSK